MRTRAASILTSLPGGKRFGRPIYRAIRAIPAWSIGKHPKYSRRRINVMNEFPAFAPASLGSYEQLDRATRDGIQRVFPAISELLAETGQVSPLGITSIPEFHLHYPLSGKETDQLERLFKGYGSDKAAKHNYHLVYSAILSSPSEVNAILEVGLGSNDPNVMSFMGKGASPGASLRAFRDHLPNAQVYGADIDPLILFKEERIRTYYTDQTDMEELARLAEALPQRMDLVIDDGLHSPLANIHTLTFGLNVICDGGWVVVEDIARDAYPIWAVVGTWLQFIGFEVFYIETASADLFAVRRRV